MTRGAVIRGENGSIAVEEYQLPGLGPGDVRVRIRAAGVCHSDLSMTNGTLASQYPLVLGHEAAGQIVEIGSGVTSSGVGDAVVLNWSPGCGGCWFCLREEPWLCSEASGAASRPGGSLDGHPLHVALGIGALAEEVVVPEAAVVPLPAGVGFELGAVLGCAVLTGVGAVVNTARVAAGDSVVVFGIGGVGLSVLAGATAIGADPVIAVDVSADKEPLARALGATDFVLAGAEAGRRVRALTGGRGADHAFECVGTAATVRAAWSASRRGGQCVVVGIGRQDDPVLFTPMELYYFNRRLTSSMYGSSLPARDIPALAAQLASGRLVLDGLITDRVPLDAVPDAFDRLRAGVGGRLIATFDEPP